MTLHRTDPRGLADDAGMTTRRCPRTVRRLRVAALSLAWPLLAQGAAATDATRAELARLVQQSRAQPERALPAFDALMPQLADDAALQIEALVVLGQLHTVLAD